MFANTKAIIVTLSEKKKREKMLCVKYCLSELEESTNKWPCYECNKRFKTSALLQKHLTIHDNSRDYTDVMDDSDTDVTIDFGKGKAGKNGKVK